MPFSQVLRLLPRVATFGANSPLRLIYRVFYVIASECKARARQSTSIKGDFTLWIATNLHRYALQILAMTSGRICHEFKAFFIKMTNAKFRVIASKKERKRFFAWQSKFTQTKEKKCQSTLIFMDFTSRYALVTHFSLCEKPLSLAPPRSLRSLAMTAHLQHIFISLPQIFLIFAQFLLIHFIFKGGNYVS